MGQILHVCAGNMVPGGENSTMRMHRARAPMISDGGRTTNPAVFTCKHVSTVTLGSLWVRGLLSQSALPASLQLYVHNYGEVD